MASLSLVENYMYFYHTDTLILLPTYPSSIQDSMSASFQSSNPLSRTAPIYSYSGSGPRTVQVSFSLHREMVNAENYKNSKLNLEIGDDYMDTMIKQLEGAVLPEYSAKEKMVNPPIVAVRFGDDIFCKGIINGGISKTFGLPIIQDRDGKNRYAIVEVSFSVSEVEPYDAITAMQAGSFRGLDTSLERNIWKRAE